MSVGILEISSWRGISIGAVHWYASLKMDDPKAKYGLTTIELTRPLLAEEVKTMNAEAKAQGYMARMYRIGEQTEGFNTEEEAIQAGIKYFNEHYTGVLYKGQYSVCSAWQDLLVWPKEHDIIAKSMTKLAKQFQALNGYECKPKDLPTIERLDNRWQKRYFKLNDLCQDTK